ncbi:MAG: dockerin type I repeat-containing protein [Oscillospiraceae bacterium]|nr:dockerin type I repeat-containing protein [Oscillospiraceae bacterium]
MKKMMRFAAMLASASMMCAMIPIQPASAQIWTLVGSETETAFQDMIQLNDKGMLNFSGSDVPYQVYMQYVTDYYDKEVTDPDTGETGIERMYYDNCRVYMVSPVKDTLWFVLREDQPDAEEQMLAIMDQYYPEISQTFAQRVPNEYASLNPSFYVFNDGSSTGPHLYELWDLTEHAGSQERSDSILHDLAEAGLITEFYTWGQGAFCQQYYGWLSYAEDGFDKEKVERYLTEHAPDCTVAEHIHESAFPDTVLTWKDYELVPGEDMSFAEQFALAADIYEETGIRPALSCFFEAEQQVLGQNALAAAGDVNLDCSIDVSDAVLIARFAAEDREAVITDQGRQNADVTHDGNVDAQDAEKILQYIAKKIIFEDLAK